MTHSLAHLVSIVREIGQTELLPRFNRIGFSRKADGSVVTEADMAAHEALLAALHAHSPGIPVLSEEMPEGDQQAILDTADSTFWLIDPLDGTSNFVAGFPFFSVSVARIEGGLPVLGLTYDPSRDECFHAQRGGGAWLNETPLKTATVSLDLRNAVALVDFKRLSDRLGNTLAVDAPYASQRNLGSSALEWAWMAAQRGHVYLHGGQKLWDHAAGSLILAEAGGHSETLDGEATFHRGLAPRSVVASPCPSLFRQWRDWLRQYQGTC